MRERRNINFELEEEEASLLLGLIGDRILDLQLSAGYRLLSTGEEEEKISLSNLDMELRDLISSHSCNSNSRNSFIGFEAAAQLSRSGDEIAEKEQQPENNSSCGADRRAARMMGGTIPAPIANDPVEW